MAKTKKNTRVMNGELATQIHESVKLRPSNFKCSNLHWKHLVRVALKGDVILIVGPSGCGKSMSAYAVKDALNRPFFRFPVGDGPDARQMLIGNTHFNPTEGTYVAESEFITAIQTPNAIVLLDEISRAHPDVWNLLMTVLDKKQRYLRISERPGSPMINVDPSVSFFLTANIGAKYTATRTLDRALLDRSKLLEVNPLSAAEEIELLTELFPAVQEENIKAVAGFAEATRQEVKLETPSIDDIISTRMTIEMVDMINDGFTMAEACEICVYPIYPDEGGPDSPRAFVKKMAQQFIPFKSEDAATKAAEVADDASDLPW